MSLVNRKFLKWYFVLRSSISLDCFLTIDINFQYIGELSFGLKVCDMYSLIMGLVCSPWLFIFIYLSFNNILHGMVNGKCALEYQHSWDVKTHNDA